MPTDKQLANLRPIRSTSEARALGKKGGKASGKTRRLYASMRECANELVDDDKKKELVEMLLDLSLKRKNLNAFDRLMKVLGEDTEVKTEESKGGVIVIPERNDT